MDRHNGITDSAEQKKGQLLPAKKPGTKAFPAHPYTSRERPWNERHNRLFRSLTAAATKVIYHGLSPSVLPFAI